MQLLSLYESFTNIRQKCSQISRWVWMVTSSLALARFLWRQTKYYCMAPEVCELRLYGFSQHRLPCYCSRKLWPHICYSCTNSTSTNSIYVCLNWCLNCLKMMGNESYSICVLCKLHMLYNVQLYMSKKWADDIWRYVTIYFVHLSAADIVCEITRNPIRKFRNWYSIIYF